METRDQGLSFDTKIYGILFIIDEDISSGNKLPRFAYIACIKKNIDIFIENSFNFTWSSRGKFDLGALGLFHCLLGLRTFFCQFLYYNSRNLMIQLGVVGRFSDIYLVLSLCVNDDWV